MTRRDILNTDHGITARVIPAQQRDKGAELALLSWLLDIRRRRKQEQKAA